MHVWKRFEDLPCVMHCAWHSRTQKESYDLMHNTISRIVVLVHSIISITTPSSALKYVCFIDVSKIQMRRVPYIDDAKRDSTSHAKKKQYSGASIIRLPTGQFCLAAIRRWLEYSWPLQSGHTLFQHKWLYYRVHVHIMRTNIYNFYVMYTTCT